MAGMGTISSASRKLLSESILPVPIVATAVVGASFTQRVIATLADRTINLVRGGQRYETRFFSTEGEGRAWLVRKRLEMKRPAGGG